MGLSLPLAAAPQSGPDRVLDKLVAVYPYSTPGAMTSTPDGNYLYVAEGGAIAIIDADPNDPGAATHFANPIKRQPVGSLGVLPVNMVLDPDITLPAAPIGYQPTYGENDLLYIAGGRDGLWVMQADVTVPWQPNLAFRVDDATLVAPGAAQDSRRWCSDVDVITLGTPGNETTYLLALFAAKDDSELRMYDLADVRNVAQSGMETGAEIVADTKTPLGRHPSLGPQENLFSFAFGMDVDDVTKRVYIAMGYHGLARVWMKNLPPYPFAQWGPYFGDGSPYAQSGVDPDLYGNLEYWENGSLVFEHPPLFLDVAVESRGPGKHRVWAAADHVGVVGFNLDAASGWCDFIYGTNGEDFHQEGIKQSEGPPLQPPYKYWSQLVPGVPEEVMAFARRVQVVENASSATLLATTMPTPFLRYPGARNMGRHMFYDLSHIGGLPGCSFADASDEKPGYTLAYYLDYVYGLPSGYINAGAVVDIGRQMYAPEQQSAGGLTFFAGKRAPYSGFTIPDADRGTPAHHTTARFDFVGNWYPNPPYDYHLITPLDSSAASVVRREGTHRPGRWTYRVSLNEADPRVLVTTSNDAGLPPDGPLVLDLGDAGGAKIEANFTTGDLDLDADCTQGMAFEPSAAIALGEFEYRFAYRHCSDPTGKGPRWRFTKTWKGLNVTQDVGSDAPEEVKAIFFSMPRDKFDSTGSYYYMGGGRSVAYTSETGKNYLFVDARETPGGIWVLDLDELIDAIDNQNNYITNDGEHYFLMGKVAALPPWDRLVIGELTAHPEYWNIPDFRHNVSFRQACMSRPGPLRYDRRHHHPQRRTAHGTRRTGRRAAGSGRGPGGANRALAEDADQARADAAGLVVGGCRPGADSRRRRDRALVEAGLLLAEAPGGRSGTTSC